MRAQPCPSQRTQGTQGLSQKWKVRRGACGLSSSCRGLIAATEVTTEPLCMVGGAGNLQPPAIVMTHLLSPLENEDFADLISNLSILYRSLSLLCLSMVLTFR